jgi:hypothetical protein
MGFVFEAVGSGLGRILKPSRAATDNPSPALRGAMSGDEKPHVQIVRPGTRLRMVCLKLEQQHGMPGGTVRLSPVTGYGGLENKEFWKYTPSGTFEFNSINPAAYDNFRLGREYYVDIVPVPERQRMRETVDGARAEIDELERKGPIVPGTWQAQRVEENGRQIAGALQRLRELDAGAPEQ